MQYRNVTSVTTYRLNAFDENNRNQSVQLLAGAWSYTRPSVIFTAATDGALYLWDILAQRINPTLCCQVSWIAFFTYHEKSYPFFF